MLKNTANLYPLPYTERHLPFDQRKGAQVWPNGARMAILLYTAPEEYRWDRLEERYHAEMKVLMNPKETRPSLSIRSSIKYGFEIGLPRIRDIVEERGIKISLLTNGNAAEQHPEIIKEFSDLGHEIVGHAYCEAVPMSTMTREEQKEDIQKSVKILADLTGKKPSSWLGPAALCNEDTIELLAEEGFLCNCDLQDDELPYFIDINGKTLVEVPYRMVGNINDFFIATRHQQNVEDILTYLKRTFDAYYREASVRPLLFNFGTHPFIIGRPDTAYAFAAFIDYVKYYKDVWITTYSEVAKWWSKKFGKGYKI